MGHRASIAYKTGSGIEAHYSHWGALDVGLLDSITKGDKFAGGQIEREPYWTGDTLTEWAEEAIDYLYHEAVYVVDEDFNVRAFTPVRFLKTESDSVGVLVRTEGEDEWAEFLGVEHEWESEPETRDEFHKTVKEEFRGRIPRFSQFYAAV